MRGAGSPPRVSLTRPRARPAWDFPDLPCRRAGGGTGASQLLGGRHVTPQPLSSGEAGTGGEWPPGRWPFLVAALGASSLCPWPELALPPAFLLNAYQAVGRGLKATAIALTSHLLCVLGRGQTPCPAIATLPCAHAHPAPGRDPCGPSRRRRRPPPEIGEPRPTANPPAGVPSPRTAATLSLRTQQCTGRGSAPPRSFLLGPEAPGLKGTVGAEDTWAGGAWLPPAPPSAAPPPPPHPQVTRGAPSRHRTCGSGADLRAGAAWVEQASRRPWHPGAPGPSENVSKDRLGRWGPATLGLRKPTRGAGPGALQHACSLTP